jgi:hypothetical protein
LLGLFDFGRRFRFFLEPLAPFVGRHELLHPRVPLSTAKTLPFASTAIP